MVKTLVDDFFTIQLDKGLCALVDKCDYKKVSPYNWHAKRGGHTWYPRTSIDGRQRLMHQVILGEKDGFTVDHRNGNGLDNRRTNLRWATHAENMRNSRKVENAASKYKGVRFLPNGWNARIMVDKKRIDLGCFGKEPGGEIKAAKAYDRAAVKYFGEFASTNFEYPSELDI